MIFNNTLILKTVCVSWIQIASTMKIKTESLSAHDYTQKIRALSRKGAVLRKKSSELNALLNATFKKCTEMLHPNQDKKK